MSSRDWNRRVWRLAGPIMLSNVSVPLLGAVDTAVVGHLPGPQYIGAVAVGSVVFNFIYWGFGFLRMGTTGLTAQALGAEDPDEVRAMFLRAMGIAVILGALILLFQAPFAWAAFGLMGASPEVDTLAREYFAIRIWAAPAALANFALLGWFIGVHKAGAALALQVLANGVNIVLDLWFVMGLGLGVKGVAIASVIAQLSSVALGLWLVARIVRPMGGGWRLDRALHWVRLRRMMGINRDIFIRTLFITGAFALFTALSARTGDVFLAANAILLQMHAFMAYLLDGFAHAAEPLVGGAVGGRDRARLRQAIRVTSLWATGFAALMSAVYALLGPAIIDVMTSLPEVRATTRQFLPWMIAAPMVGVLGFMLDGVYIGMTRTTELRNCSVVAFVVYALSLVVLFPSFGNHGLWMGYVVFMLGRAVSLGALLPGVIRQVPEAEPRTAP